MTLTRRNFLATSGMTALIGAALVLREHTSSHLVGEGPRSGQSEQSFAFMTIDQRNDTAVIAKPRRLSGEAALTISQKAPPEELYGWIRAQCDELSGQRLVALSDAVGDLMLTLALRDLAATMILAGKHVPDQARADVVDHRITLFGLGNGGRKVRNSLETWRWTESHSLASSGELVALSSADWVKPFATAMMQVFAPHAMPASAAALERLDSDFLRGRASKYSILADI